VAGGQATGMVGMPQWGGDVAVQSPVQMLPGGSGLNSSIALAAFQRDGDRDKIVGAERSGVETTLHAPLAEDAFGAFLRDGAEQAGVDLQAVALPDQPEMGTGRGC
jgi:hypothetical protein